MLATAALAANGGEIRTDQGVLSARRVINCAGLYADKIASWFGFGRRYTIIPFKGLYLKYKKNKTDIVTNIYRVPNLNNPFLGVHFTKAFDGTIKIGPTAIPALWRENYRGLSRMNLMELIPIVVQEARLFASNSFGFRDLAFEEVRRYRRSYFIKQARLLVRQIDEDGFGEYSSPGIRAQLLDRQTSKLVMDFVVEGDKRSVHILNAVSPGFTCAFSFADYVIDKHVLPL